MVKVNRIRLDVLKPHQPNILEFATGLGAEGPGYRVEIRVLEMDENTETLEIVIEGDDIQFDRIADSINRLGGSLHSIDEVAVRSADTAPNN